MANEYEITTMLDLLALEDDQIDRLCAELPSVIKHAKNLMGLLDAVGEAIGEDSQITQMLTPLRWIDDGEQNIDIKMSDGSGASLNYEVRSK